MKSIRKITALLLAGLLLLAAGCAPGVTPAQTPATQAFTEVSDTEAVTASRTEEASQTESLPASESEEQAPSTEEETEASTAPVTTPEATTTEEETEAGLTVKEDGEYLSLEEVALYIHLYGHLPSNYLTKNEAENLGWSASKGNLWDVAPGAAIGGNKFGNYEKRLPEKNGRRWYECDVNYEGGFRGAERILFSNDGLIYYTADHYNTFTLLYGEE